MVAVSAVTAEQTERYTPLVMENLEPWRRAVDRLVDPQKYPLASKFLRDLPQEIALVPGGVFGFRATLLEAAARGDTKAIGEIAESMARPFYSPVQSFKENPAGTVLMWAMVGGTYAKRLRGQVKASNEAQRQALRAFDDMTAKPPAGARPEAKAPAEGQSASPLHDQARALQARTAAKLPLFRCCRRPRDTRVSVRPLT